MNKLEVEKNTNKKYRYVVLAIFCLCSITINYSQAQLSPLANEIMQQYHISKMQFSALYSAPMLPAVLLSIPAGVLVDKIGIKKLVGVSLMMGMLGALGRVFVSGYYTFYVCMVLSGIALIFINAANVKIFGLWFPPIQVSVVVGVLMSAGALGKTLGTGTTAFLPSSKVAFLITAFAYIITFFCWIFFMKEEKTVPYKSQKEDGIKATFYGIKSVIVNKYVFICSIALMCIYGAYYVANAYLPATLTGRGYSAVSAGVIASMVTIGYCLGCLIIPMLIRNKRYKRAILFLFGLIGAVIIAVGSVYLDGVGLVVAVTMIGICVGGLLPSIFSLPIQLPEIGAKYAGTAGGILSTMQLFGAVVIPTYIIVPASSGDYIKMFLYAGISMLFVCVCSLFFPKSTGKINGI